MSTMIGALPVPPVLWATSAVAPAPVAVTSALTVRWSAPPVPAPASAPEALPPSAPPPPRSEEHTSELQSLMRNSDDVLCLKKKNIDTQNANNTSQHQTKPNDSITSYNTDLTQHTNTSELTMSHETPNRNTNNIAKQRQQKTIKQHTKQLSNQVTQNQ